MWYAFRGRHTVYVYVKNLTLFHFLINENKSYHTLNGKTSEIF